ncbi:T9SS type A sorting domain-containing protein [candidate division KSB1 bacterium]|nr:T9SS type A sorting domain-containing protein [candidate division KSB1 bacterium]
MGPFTETIKTLNMWRCGVVVCVFCSLIFPLSLYAGIDFSGSPREGYAPLVVEFQDESTGFKPGEYDEVQWFCPGGTPERSTGSTTTVTYHEPGYYDVTMRLMRSGSVYRHETKNRYIHVLAYELDWGDANNLYHTLEADDGPRHIVCDTLYLGTPPDAEEDGIPTLDASGDDENNRDDEDGVTFPSPLIPNGILDIRFDIHGTGYLHGWIDFNADGDFEDPGETIFSGTFVRDGGFLHPVMTVPADAYVGRTTGRFRISSDETLGPTGPGAPGEVEDHMIRILHPYDFGDAPHGVMGDDGIEYDYATTGLTAPKHHISFQRYLGSHVDGEPNGQPSLGATGDDTDGSPNDEDGVVLPMLVKGTSNSIRVTTHGSGALHAWIDLNGNHRFDHPDENVLRTALGEGEFTPLISIPMDAAEGHTYARFRYSDDSFLSPTGRGGYGEVEDYAVVILPANTHDFGDAPDSYSTTEASGGPSHVPSPRLHLGATMADTESDAHVSANADGDDNAGADDENGITFVDPFIPGELSRISIHAVRDGVEALLYCWIDYNQNGDFSEPGEYVFIHELSGSGPISEELNIMVPIWARTGPTFARFRLSSQSDLSFNGPGGAGEVEDYQIEIVTNDGLDFGDMRIAGIRTTLAENGPRHPIHPDIRLGDIIDGEEDVAVDVIPSLADDHDAADDEDGWDYNVLSPGDPIAILHIQTHNSSDRSAYLHGWMDLNKNDHLDEPAEKIIDGIELGTGLYAIKFNLPFMIDPLYAPLRLRYSTDARLGTSGLGGYGEVEDYLVPLGFDFGDAPGSELGFNYPTTRAEDGAYHTVTRQCYLGEFIDHEQDGLPRMTADGDDENTSIDDEDGIIIPLLRVGQPATLQATVHLDPERDFPVAGLYGWIDFNRDGDWEDPGEYAVTGVTIHEPVHTFGINVPADAVPGHTWARFRLTAEPVAVTYSGYGGRGEVEDYLVYIDDSAYDFGDAPDSYGTYLSNNGARHPLSESHLLGSTVDPELDGQPNASATGDDITNSDEDGIVFLDDIIPGQPARISVTNLGLGFLWCWADFNQDGDFSDAEETVFRNVNLMEGTTDLSFDVPSWTGAGKVYLRFRFTRSMIIFPFEENYSYGSGPPGEVEDYMVQINSAVEAQKWYQPPLKNKKSYYGNSYWGWDESSAFAQHIMADDWFCGDDRPVTGIRWWGGYDEWQDTEPPAAAPEEFYLAIWTDSTRNAAFGEAQPNKLIWEKTVNRNQLNETAVGSNFYNESMAQPDTCFEYYYDIPMSSWFYQNGDSTYYWLSIAAKYNDGMPYSNRWGWKTRERYFRSPGYKIIQPASPAVDSLFRQGVTIHPNFDMAFELITNLYEMDFDYGDADTTTYATLFKNNGAHHFYWPGIHLGESIDLEPDGLGNSDASRDDQENSDDEDGVEFPDEIRAGSVAQLVVDASCRGILNAWIDYNSDGDWTDNAEQILIDMPVHRGNNNLIINIPPFIEASTYTSRFRFSGSGGLSPTGLAIGGEVEDHTLSISYMTDVETKRELSQPDQFNLLQNYPNPFNPTTTIAFQLTQPAEVLINIYDIRGRLVKTLVHGQWTTGEHHIPWNGINQHGQLVATGIYFYRIEMQSLQGDEILFSDVKKMLFVK